MTSGLRAASPAIRAGAFFARDVPVTATHRCLPLLLALATACAPKVPPAPAGDAPDPVPSLEPVYFSYGKATLSSADDEARVDDAAATLAGDKRQVLVVIGYADPSGTEGANLSLSQARAEVVREALLARAQVDEGRVIARGLGELDRSGRANTSLRRVDLIPLELGPLDSRKPDRIVAALVEAGRIDKGAQAVLGASAQSGAPGSSAPAGAASGAASAAGERDNIVPTGLSDVDAVFAQVQGLLDTVRGAQDDITAADANLRAALGVDEGSSIEESLAALKTEAKGAIKLEMSGGKPRLSTKPGASPKATKAVGAVNGLVRALGNATQKLAAVPKQAQAVIAQAKTIPGTLPNTLKAKGMGMKELPAMLKAVKKNIKLTASVPKECAQVGKRAATTFKAIGSAFR